MMLLQLAILCEQYDMCKLLLDFDVRSNSAIDCNGK
jgi:hypothetical protein